MLNLLTGLLAAAGIRQMASGTAAADSNLRRTGPVRLRHRIPGRVRFVVPFLAGRPTSCREIETQLGKLKDVRQIVISPVSGSVTVRYTGSRLSPALLFEILVGLLRLEREVRQPGASLVGGGLKGLAQGFDLALFEKTGGIVDLRTVALLVLIGMGLGGLAADRWKAFPGGVTLLWWVWQDLMAEGRERR